MGFNAIDMKKKKKKKKKGRTKKTERKAFFFKYILSGTVLLELHILQTR